MARYRLAIVTSHPVQYQAPLFRALASAHDVDLQVFYCYSPTPEQQGDAGFGVKFDWDVPLLDGYSYAFLSKTSKIRNVITRNRYDAVVVNGWSYSEAIQTILACWASRTPVMVRSDSHLNTPRHPVKKLIKYFPYRAFIIRMDACLAVGRWSREYYLNYGAKRERVFQVPHVIDQNRFDREIERRMPERNAFRRMWGLADNAVVFLFVGKFIVEKCPNDFVMAVRRAACQDRRIQGLMVGDGPLRTECQSLAQREQAPVQFAGFLNQSEISKAYIATDAIVLPSCSETWGMVVNEAMFCGLPCLVTNKVGCGPDLVSPETGAIFGLGNIEQLAALLTAFSKDVHRLKVMGQTARNLIVQQYSPLNGVHGILEAVRTVGRCRPLYAEDHT